VPGCFRLSSFRRGLGRWRDERLLLRGVGDCDHVGGRDVGWCVQVLGGVMELLLVIVVLIVITKVRFG